MNRCIVTFGVGAHEELLEIALPTFERFGDRHGYEVVVVEPDAAFDRPWSWRKVPALREMLDLYDEALWIDSDVVIVDDAEDLDIPASSWQALVEHHTNCGHVPNLGVWFVRQRMLPILHDLWAAEQYIDHGWWEQSSMLDLLGYEFDPLPSSLKRPTPLYARTHFLETGWNVHVEDARKSARPRFLHATMYADRAAVMRRWADEALAVAP